MNQQLIGSLLTIGLAFFGFGLAGFCGFLDGYLILISKHFGIDEMLVDFAEPLLMKKIHDNKWDKYWVFMFHFMISMTYSGCLIMALVCYVTAWCLNKVI